MRYVLKLVVTDKLGLKEEATQALELCRQQLVSKGWNAEVTEEPETKPRRHPGNPPGPQPWRMKGGKKPPNPPPDPVGIDAPPPMPPVVPR